MTKVKIRPNERIFVSGMTGTGKTTFVKEKILPILPRFIFYDNKGTNQDLDEDHVVVESLEEVEEALFPEDDSERIGKMVYRPTDVDENSKEGFNQLCKLVYNAPGYHLVIDEVAKVCAPNTIPEYYKHLLTMGRERKVGVTSVTQRPRQVHNTPISEANHFILFRQQLETDRDALEKVIGPTAQELNNLDGKHYYIYYQFGMEEGVVCQPIEV